MFSHESARKHFVVAHLSPSNGFSFSPTLLTDLDEKLKGTPWQELNGLGKGPVWKFHNTNRSPARAAHPLGPEWRSAHPRSGTNKAKSLAKADAEFTSHYPEPLPRSLKGHLSVCPSHFLEGGMVPRGSPSQKANRK